MYRLFHIQYMSKYSQCPMLIFYPYKLQCIIKKIHQGNDEHPWDFCHADIPSRGG